MYTNSHIIRQNSFQVGLVSFPDKYSYQSEKKRRNGYILRIYHQFKSTLEFGGSVIFDTLTYDDAYLPRIQQYADFNENFSCFSPADIRSFFWYLRDLSPVQFKYFLTSEYGSECEYTDYAGRVRKATHRPHYHVLFFFDCQIDPFLFAKLVHKAWHRGRTDNFGNRGEVSRNKVLHNYFTGNNVDLQRRIKLANYLSKYTLKDAKYSQRVENMCKAYVRQSYSNLNNLNRKSFNHDVRQLTSKIQPFLRISNGFGLSACSDIDVLKLICERSEMRIPDAQFRWKVFSIPTYYLRKLFYRCNHGEWQLTDVGKMYIPIHLANRKKRLSKVYETAFANMPVDAKLSVHRLLAGRSFGQLAEYVTYYKGRIFNPSFLDDYPTIPFMVSRFVSDDYFGCLNQQLPLITYTSAIEPRTLYFWHDDLLLPAVVSMQVQKRSFEPQTDWRDWIIDDTWFYEWRDFDVILEIIHYYISVQDIPKSDTYFRKQSLQLDLFSKYGIKSVI